MISPTKQRHNELMQHVAPLPEILPEVIAGKPKLVDRVFPHVKTLYTNEDFRVRIGSLDAEHSPNGSPKFDHVEAAQMVRDQAKDAGDEDIVNVKLVKIATAMTFALRRFGVARSQRIAEARSLMLSAASQPAE
jgi:hypothetical protein